MRPGHRGQRSASTSEAPRSVVRARHRSCAGGGAASLNPNSDGVVLFFCVLRGGVGLLLFYCVFVDRGGEVMGDGLAGADQTLTTSPTSLARCRGLPPPPLPLGVGLQSPALLPHIPELSRLKSAEAFREECGVFYDTFPFFSNPLLRPISPAGKRVKMSQPAPDFLAPSSPLSPCRIHPSVWPTVAAHLCPRMTC